MPDAERSGRKPLSEPGEIVSQSETERAVAKRPDLSSAHRDEPSSFEAAGLPDEPDPGEPPIGYAAEPGRLVVESVVSIEDEPAEEK